jgi:hypothetical protein
MEFSNRAPEYRIGDPNDPSEEADLRNRILSVIDYLLLIQQKQPDRNAVFMLSICF